MWLMPACTVRDVEPGDKIRCRGHSPDSATMLHIVRAVVFAILRYSGVPYLLREVVQRGKVTIVVYHSPAVERAKEHFRVLGARYNVIALSDYVRARKENRIGHLPPKSLIITLDDGHQSNFALKPVLEETRLPITIFLCSGIVGTHRHYWWSHTASAEEAEACKRMADADRRKFLLSRGYTDDAEYPDRQALSSDEIEELKPYVDFQAHTATHPILPACADEVAELEILDSKAHLESRYDLNIRALAFPNGDYSKREINLARKAGYSCALTLDCGFNHQNTDLFRLRRIPVPDEASVSELLVKSSGLWDVFRSPAHLKIRRREVHNMRRQDTIAA
jgi:peptidoglycan/xylan/chitin deacetylase (PgdA/CDA1 family)